MDLSKIINESRASHLQNKRSLEELGKEFFNELIKQLEMDLLYLQSQVSLPQHSFFKSTRILQGDLDEKKKKIEKKAYPNKRYLFMQLPNQPGFLLEAETLSEIYKMYRATKVNPIFNSDTGDIIRPEIFILKSKELEEFIVLDECFVRTKTSDKTLSVKQMSEMLLLLAESVR